MLPVLRWLLWLVVAWILVRGVVSIASPPVRPAADLPAGASPAPVDTEGARLFATLFTREYLTWAAGAGTTEDRIARLAPYLAPHLDPTGGLTPGSREESQAVTGAWSWGLKALSDERAQVTVLADVTSPAASKQGARPRRIALIVPVALTRDGYVVYDYPAFVPPPAPGRWEGPIYTGTPEPDAVQAVHDLLSGFLRAYVQGTPAELSYFLVPGASVNGLSGGFQLRDVSEPEVLKTGDDHWAVVEATLEDTATGAAYRQRFLVKLARRDRWYVEAIQQKGDWSQ